MRKQNVFLVSGRQSVAGDPRGVIRNHVICSKNEEAVRVLVTQRLPGFVPVSVMCLTTFESSVKKIKDVLAGTDTSWQVLVEEGL